MKQERMIEIEMRYTSEFGEMTLLNKKIPSNWLGLDEKGIFNKIYNEFLSACTFLPDSEAEIFSK